MVTVFFGTSTLWTLILSFPRLPHPGFWIYGILSHLWLWNAVDSGWLQPRNMVRHLILVLKANSWLFVCNRGKPGQIQSRYLEALQSSQNFPAHARSGRMWLHHVLVSNKEHPSFPSDREIPNFSEAVGYLKIYISVPGGCSSLSARETCPEARGSYRCQWWQPSKLNLGISSAGMSPLVHVVALFLSLETMEANSALICEYCYCWVIEIDNKSLTSFHG